MSSVFSNLMGGSTNMRGLNEFISDIRECKDKESETKRVQLELAKIRERFTTEKGLNAYQRKKYVWKLLYIHILGYQVDFGYQEAAGLINSVKYDQKYTGYIASSLIIPQSNDQIWKSILYSVQSDIKSRNQAAQSLALSMLATIMPAALSNLTDAIFDLALSNRSSPLVRKKALVCLSRMLRRDSNQFDVKKIFSPLSQIFEGKNSSTLSLVSGGASLLLTVLNLVNSDQLKEIQPKVIRLLHRLAINKECPSNYIYYQNPNPWLQMKLYKALQIWSPPEDKGTLGMVEEIVTKILKKTDASEAINKNNIQYGLLFEVINVIIHYDDQLNPKLVQSVTKILVMFIGSSRANFRYLGLQSMCRLAVRHNLADHLQKILVNLDHPDISIRKRALDLLYLICNNKNVSTIVAQLLGYLQNRVDPHIHDDLVLKIAILAEKFAENLIWYVDVVVKLIQNAEVQNDIWYRIIQIITGFGQANADLQNYAAVKLLAALNLPHVTDTLVCVGSYVVSQFSQYLVKNGKDPRKIFDAIYKHFTNTNSNNKEKSKAKAMMLSGLAKLAVKYETLKEEVKMICHMCSQHWDPDVQQRGVQFLALFSQEQGVQAKVVSINPVFTEEQQQSNPLLKKFAKSGKRGKQLENAAKSTIKSTSAPSNPQPASFQTLANQSSVTSHPLANHPFFKAAINRLSPNLVNLIDIPGKLQLKPYWKEALVKKSAFQSCEMREKLEDGILKVILSVNAATTEMQFKVFRNKGFQVTNSPIKYGPQSQQILLTFTPNGEKIEPPAVGIAWKDTNGQIVKKQVQLPIVISKFLNPVELSYEKFNTFYKDYSLANQKFFKIDSFIKLPQGVRASDYLKKVGAFLSSVCNFKCAAHPNPNEIKLIYGSATFPLKQQGKIINYPILIEVQGYQVDKAGAIRVSLRGGNGNSLVSTYQLFIAFF